MLLHRLSDRYPTFNKPKVIALGLAAVMLAIHVWMVAGVRDEWDRMVLTDVAYPLQNLLACITLIYAARRKCASRRLFRALSALALAQGLYVLADILWSVLEVGLQIDPYPSIADFFYLAYYPIFLLGIWLLPASPNRPEERIKVLLDMSVVMLTSVLVMWVALIGPIAAGGGESGLAQALAVAYPVGDLLLLWALLVLAYRRAHSLSPAALVWLTLSMALMFLADCAYSFQDLNGVYVSGSWLDLWWVASYIALALFGVWMSLDPPQPVAGEVQRNLADLLAYMPYLWLAGAYSLLVVPSGQPRPLSDEALAIGVGCVAALVLLRQILTLLENARLSTRLQAALQSVGAQARALEASNRELQTEIEMRKRAEQQLLHDTLHDSLTGLPNRVLFLDRLRHDIAYSHRHPDFRFSVLFLDIDHFKMVNDGLGHDIGDKLLIEIAVQLRGCVREGDTVARLGGDEFVILLEDADLIPVGEVAEKIQERLNGPYQIGGHLIRASASIGVVHHQHEPGQAEDLLRDADVAMYQAKANGRARSEVFNPELRERLVARMELERDLRRAIEQQEFRLDYQPIVSVADGKLYGFEALLRWEHPQRGTVYPQHFIQLAEDSGQIFPLGCWSLREACRQMAAWQKQLPGLRDLAVSVNISTLQFRQSGLVDQVAAILAETGLEGRCLRLEITESVYLHDPENATVTLNRLNELGVSLHIDDFGTGYSSLSYLHSFPIGAIKIDRSFTFKLGVESHSEIVRTIISLAHDLGMVAIAEGVDHLDQLAYLKTYGCDYAQGFLFSMPLSVAEVEAKYAAGFDREPFRINEPSSKTNSPSV